MTAFPQSLLGDFGGGSRSGRHYSGFDSRRAAPDHVMAVIGNLGFIYDLRTGEIHVRVMSALKGKSADAHQAE